jgi:hypothetical protein
LLLRMQVFLNGNSSGRTVNQIYNASSGTVTLSSGVNPLVSGLDLITGLALLPTARAILTIGFSGSTTACALYSIDSDSWALTGSLDPSGNYAQDTIGISLTVLDDGTALAVGGQGLYNNNPNLAILALDRSELYSPATGTWSATASPLNLGRDGAVATLLQSGDVLLAGGSVDTPGQIGMHINTASVELYNHVRAPSHACAAAGHGLSSACGTSPATSARALALTASVASSMTNLALVTSALLQCGLMRALHAHGRAQSASAPCLALRLMRQLRTFHACASGPAGDHHVEPRGLHGSGAAQSPAPDAAQRRCPGLRRG